MINFKKEIEEFKDEAYPSGKSKLFSVATQQKILRAHCENNTLNYRWEQKTVPIISPLAHTISVSIMILNQDNSILVEGLGVSTRYGWEYTDLARNSATENALTIAKGKAMADLGIVYDNALRSVEEQKAWEKLQDIQLSPDLGKIAMAFSMLDEDTKYLAQKQGLSIANLVGVFNPSENTVDDMKNMIVDGTILEAVQAHQAGKDEE